eukprot:scaffold4595_cov191-Alexandrium_tamarense.AAC.1
MVEADQVDLNDAEEDQHKLTLCIIKSGAVLSMLATFFILRDIFLRYHKGETIRLTSMIVAEWSASIFCASFFSPFMSTWMVPKESGAYLASGTTQSCTAQGFFDSLFYGTGVLLYAVLSVTYCVLVKKKRKDETRTKQSLMLILGIPPLICFCLAIMPLFNDAYNITELHICSIAEYPIGCLADNDPSDCTRGTKARKMWVSRFAFVCVTNAVIIVSVLLLIKSVLSREKRRNQHTRRNNTENDTEQSTKVKWQGIWYILAFQVSCIPWYVWQFIRISRALTLTSSDLLQRSALLYTLTITYPMQGVWVTMVYFRPQYLKHRERGASDLRIASVLRVLNINVPCLLSVEWWRGNNNIRDSSVREIKSPFEDEEENAEQS